MSTKTSFEIASMLINEEQDFTTIEISIDFDANAPMHAMHGISRARGISTDDVAVSNLSLSEDKKTFSIPVEVNISSLENFCEDVRDIVPEQYLRGFHITHKHDDMKQSLNVAIDTILAAPRQYFLEKMVSLAILYG